MSEYNFRRIYDERRSDKIQYGINDVETIVEAGIDFKGGVQESRERVEKGLWDYIEYSCVGKMVQI